MSIHYCRLLHCRYRTGSNTRSSTHDTLGIHHKACKWAAILTTRSKNPSTREPVSLLQLGELQAENTHIILFPCFIITTSPLAMALICYNNCTGHSEQFSKTKDFNTQHFSDIQPNMSMDQTLDSTIPVIYSHGEHLYSL
jgi:hypothetical protein